MDASILSRLVNRAGVAALAALPILGGGYSPTSQATDIEVFFTSAVTTTGIPPNVIFLLDTSTSMWTPTEGRVEPYVKETTYLATGCDPTAYYYVSGASGGAPTCDSSTKVNPADFYCAESKLFLESNKSRLTIPSKLAERYNKTSGSPATRGLQWRSLQRTLNTPIICQGDEAAPRPDSDFPPDWPNISEAVVTLYHGNYLAYLAVGETGDVPRIQVMKNAIQELAQTTRGINLSLMRFGAGNELATTTVGDTCVPVTNPDESTGSAGDGIVVMEMLNIDAPGTRDLITHKLFTEMVPGQGAAAACPMQLFTPNGRTGMGTALYEAYAYYRGDAVSSNNRNESAGIGSQHRYWSVPESRGGGGDPNRYRSPIVDGCAKNYIVMLSDGTTEQDRPSDGDITRLQEPAGVSPRRSFSDIVGKCEANPELAGMSPPGSDCVDELAEFMFRADATASIEGLQNVKTYTIGFALDARATQNAEPLLKRIASGGGGTYFRADDATGLRFALDDVIRAVLTDNATFTAPAVTVDAFNRTRNLDDIYVSLFRPERSYRWPGNIKKFRLDENGNVVDANGAPAVDPADGFLLATSQSLWSAAVDGKDITSGGAASKLPAWSSRLIYSNLTGSSNITFTSAGTANQLSAVKGYSMPAARTLLGLPASGEPAPADLVDWLYGRDLDDVDADLSNTDTRHDMGDPLHSRPTVLVYGGSAAEPDPTDARLFVTTNDGMLHSFDTESGIERWAFKPQNLLQRARDLYFDENTTPEDRVYGLDSPPRLLIFDTNGNGIIEPEDAVGKRDRAYLFFGMRRGGMSYYGFDVTNKDAPRLMWITNPPGAGQSWSVPQPARVRVGNTDRVVLIVSGGYSVDHEDTSGDPPAWRQYPNPNDPVGNRIYMIDALNGAVLWNAGLSGATGVDLGLADMKHAFAGDVRVLDLTGDGFANRMYAADLGGRVWRFDIFNGKNATGLEGDRLVEGGVFASLGNADDASPAPSNTRRFFYAPDAVPMNLYGRAIINIGLGSGHREFPATDAPNPDPLKSQLVTQDGFFSMRDLNRFSTLLSSQYKASCVDETGPCHQVIREADLEDLTSIVGDVATDTVAAEAKGWKIWLSQAYGEKVLSEARTLGGQTFFTTYEPTPREARPDACGVNFGTNRLYVVNTIDARPVYPRDAEFNVDTDGDGVADAFEERARDRFTELAQTGIAAEVVFLFTDQLVPGTSTGQRRVFCLSGFASCPPGLSVEPVRTYWRQRGVQ